MQQYIQKQNFVINMRLEKMLNCSISTFDWVGVYPEPLQCDLRPATYRYCAPAWQSGTDVDGVSGLGKEVKGKSLHRILNGRCRRV